MKQETEQLYKTRQHGWYTLGWGTSADNMGGTPLVGGPLQTTWVVPPWLGGPLQTTWVVPPWLGGPL